MTAPPTPAVLAAPKAPKKRVMRIWTAEEIDFLQDRLGFVPLSEIARLLGRSAKSVTQMVRRNKAIVHPAATSDYLFNRDLAAALGVHVAPAAKLMREVLPLMTLYRADRPTMAVERRALEYWLTDNYNWPEIDLEKIADPIMAQLVENVKQRLKPSWAALRPAARLYGMTKQGMKYHVTMGRINAKKVRGRLWLWRADVERCFWPQSLKEWLGCLN